MQTQYGLQPVGNDHGSTRPPRGTTLEGAKMRAGWLARDLKLDVQVWDIDELELLHTEFAK